jgi:GNAT superfamily N-acetyltransferase
MLSMGISPAIRIARDLAAFAAAAFVLTDRNGTIASFYTLANTSILKQEVSRTQQKLYPYRDIAAIILPYMGVDRRFRGQRLGPRTLRLALERCYRLSQESGASLVTLDVETKNERAIKMYREADFRDLGERDSGPYRLLRMILPMKVIAAAVNATA